MRREKSKCLASNPKGRLLAGMCHNVRVWMVVSNHMPAPSVGQINILNHHHHHHHLRPSKIAGVDHLKPVHSAVGSLQLSRRTATC